MAYFLLPKNVTQRVFEVPMVDIEPNLGNFYRIYRSRHNENWPGDISVNFRLCLVRLLGTSKTQTLFLLRFDLEEIVRETVLVFLYYNYIPEYAQKSLLLKSRAKCLKLNKGIKISIPGDMK